MDWIDRTAQTLQSHHIHWRHTAPAGQDGTYIYMPLKGLYQQCSTMVTCAIPHSVPPLLSKGQAKGPSVLQMARH